MNIVCGYTGRPDDCPECGGFNDTGGRFCSHDCAASFAERGADHEQQRQARRAAEDAFGVEADRLRELGHTTPEIDAMLKDMP